MSQATIDELEARLQVLDRQHAYLDSLLEEIESVPVPRFRDILTNIQLIAEEVDSDWELDSVDSDSDIDTVVYHTEMWGFHPRSQSAGYYTQDDSDMDDDDDDDDDSKTVVMPWEDPMMTPVKRVINEN